MGEPPPGKVPQEVLIVVGLIVAALLFGYWWRVKLKDVSVDREINMIPIIRKPVSDGSSDSSSSCDIAMEISSDEATPLRKLRKKQPRLTDKMHEMIGNILPSDDEDEKPVEEKVEGKSKKKTKEVPADEATTRKSKRNTRKEPADEATTRKSKRNTTKEPADEATMRKSTFSESIYTTKKSKRPEGTSTRRKTENDLADEKLKKKKQKSRASPGESDSIV